MKKRMGLALLLALVSGGAAAGWVEVGRNEMLIAFADPATSVKEGNRAKLWVLLDLKTTGLFVGKPYLSLRLQNEYDCTEKQYRTLASSFHTGNLAKGELLPARSYVREWTSVPPGSIVDSLWQFACGQMVVRGGDAAARPPAPAPKPEETTSSYAAVMAFVDSNRVYDTLIGRYRDSQSLLEAVNPKLRRFIEANRLDIVLQKVVWASPRIDITDEFVREVEGKPVDRERLRNLNRIHPKVGLIDMNRIRQELVARGSVDPARILDVANQVTRQTAETQGYTLVVQQAAYAGPSIDITAAVIQRLP